MIFINQDMKIMKMNFDIKCLKEGKSILFFININSLLISNRHLLVDIKRKTGEDNQYHQTHQMVPAHKDMEIEKVKKDYNFFIQEVN